MEENEFLLSANDKLKARLRATHNEIKQLQKKNIQLSNKRAGLKSILKITSLRPIGKKKHSDFFNDRWHIIYSDLLTILLVFFVILFSYSRVDLGKFKKIIGSFKGRKVTSSPDMFLDMSRKMIAIDNLGDDVKFEFKKNIVIITINEKVLFPSGTKDLLKRANPVLLSIAKLFDTIPDHNIYVEGHTDNRPISTKQFPSNLELSTARAISVARFFIDHAKVSSDRVIVSGFADYRPVAPNDTEENMAKNRRVEIKLKKEREE